MNKRWHFDAYQPTRSEELRNFGIFRSFRIKQLVINHNFKPGILFKRIPKRYLARISTRHENSTFRVFNEQCSLEFQMIFLLCTVKSVGLLCRKSYITWSMLL